MGGATQSRQSGNNLAVDRHGSEPGPSLLHKSLTYECGDMGMVAGATWLQARRARYHSCTTTLLA